VEAYTPGECSGHKLTRTLLLRSSDFLLCQFGSNWKNEIRRARARREVGGERVDGRGRYYPPIRLRRSVGGFVSECRLRGLEAGWEVVSDEVRSGDEPQVEVYQCESPILDQTACEDARTDP
jgi:hypothetical protein